VKLAHLHQLGAWAQEELHAQRELARALEAYEQSIVRGDLPALDVGAAELDAQLSRSAAREQRRSTLIAAIAQELRLSPRVLTLRSLCARAGELGSTLAATREELEEAARRTRSLARRVAILARSQQVVLGEALDAAFGAGQAVTETQGRLVDAKG
jgi:hypothetical protein